MRGGPAGTAGGEGVTEGAGARAGAGSGPGLESGTGKAGAGADKAGANKPQGLWLEAWHDRVAGIQALPGCLKTVDIHGDGDERLVVADDRQQKLRVWRGTKMVSETPLVSPATCVELFYTDEATPRIPSLAVACGDSLYIYRNLRPYYKFTCPPGNADYREVDVWEQAAKGQLDGPGLQREIVRIRDSGVALTSRSLDMLLLESAEAMEDFILATRSQKLARANPITCMTTIRKDKVTPKGPCQLIVCTELGFVYIMDPTGTAIHQTITMPSPPAMARTVGLLNVDYRITVASRDGKIYNIKDREVLGLPIELESEVVGMIRASKNIILGCRNCTVHCYHVKGRKHWSVYLPAHILAMEHLESLSYATSQSTCFVAALANSELRVYSEKHLVSVTKLDEPVLCLHWGKFGREDNTLISILKSGTLDVKILPRTANVEPSGGAATGPPEEQDVPLNVPKKTKLYIEQTQRERKQAVEMHMIFQRELCKMKLKTARAFMQTITSTVGNSSYAPGATLQVNALIQGLGPLFKIKCTVQNTGSKAIEGCFAVLRYSRFVYQVGDPRIPLPILAPGLVYNFDAVVHAIEPSGPADPVRLLICSRKSTMPLLTALVKMPQSEPDVDEIGQ